MMRVATAVVVWAALAASSAAQQACREDWVELRAPGAGQVLARFAVEIADTDAERAQGLMHRDRMPAGRGMLFVYERPERVAFWMENTLIPLDMIFMGEDGVVRRVHPNARPLDRTAIPGGDDIQFVLEINGGLAGRMGISPGAELRHPSVDPAKAAWPCN